MLSGFCLLSKKSTPLYLLNIQYQAGWKVYQPKLDEKAYTLILHYILSFEATSYKHVSGTTTSSFISYVVLH